MWLLVVLVRLSCQCFTIPEATSCAVMGFMMEKKGALFPRGRGHADLSLSHKRLRTSHNAMMALSAPASADHSVDPLYCLLGLQNKICLEKALNFAFCGSLSERSHDPDILFLQRTIFPG